MSDPKTTPQPQRPGCRAAASGSAFWRGFRRGALLSVAYLSVVVFGAITTVLIVLAGLVFLIAMPFGEIHDRAMALVREAHRVWRDARRMQNDLAQAPAGVNPNQNKK